MFASYYFFGLNEFNEKNGHLSISGGFVFQWQDYNLRWNLSEYNNIQLIHLRMSSVWTPTLCLWNPFYELREIGRDDPNSLVFVHHSGLVGYNPGAVLDAVCQANVKYFPFDSQVCGLTFVAWYYLPGELQFELVANGNVESLPDVENGMWYIKHVKVEERIQGAITMIINFDRKPMFYIYNIILPINLICFLNIFVFLLPSDSGERVGYSVTMLLALAVFLTIVSDRLPETSNLSILGIILLLEFCMSGLILVLLIFSLRVYHTDQNKTVPTSIQRIIQCCSKDAKREMLLDYHVKWTTVSMVFDIICFWLFITIYIGFILGYILIFYKLI